MTYDQLPPGGPNRDRAPGDKEPGTGPTRVRDLLVIAVVAGVLAWILVRFNYGSMPPLPLFAGVVLYILAALEVVIGFFVRKRVSSREISAVSGHVHPLTVARLVALAKASSILGAIGTGVFAGMSVYLFRADLAAADDDKTPALIGLVGGVLLVAAALWLEYCCRAPDDPSSDPPA
ncbi:DUF3180 domain-containing protein [Gordonia jinhuaensis]|uniref:DUF3180 domain-containing protein n=1 Tax=Gordonia jinhuaensis TaxID=1517702 RepID=A0A916TC45_9ACTN|nr:DUF3180 domain-containing protein [Gordonia jinhuaensis]GGB39574.1 hypothetical protein GCM10011489_29070 [Gordonia jinhuaensis]